MSMAVEDISDDYGAHGVRCYSVVNNMEFYTVDVRASGYTVMDNKSRELNQESEIAQEIINEVRRYISE